MFGNDFLNGTTVLSCILLIPLHVESGWVDPDTPSTFYSTKAYTKDDTRNYKLVFSDEFETEGRSFADGEDPRWTAIDKNDYTNNALHYYKSKNAKTTNGVLNITTNFEDNTYRAYNEKTKKYYSDTKHVQSAMLQGWNKFCVVGGIVEFSAKLPGESNVGGLWPALWMLGNLARATYVASSDWVWPFSYDKCNNKKLKQQEVNACRKVSHYGMNAGTGRGAPEIDVLEAMGGEPGTLPNTNITRPYFSSSLQIAPGVSSGRPKLMHQPEPGHWYEGLEYGNMSLTGLNPFFYGVTLLHKPKEYTYQSDAISANTQINKSYFKEQNIYRVEWEPSTLDGSGGYVRWFLNGNFLFGITGASLNLTGASIPNEPMYLLINTAVASSWGFPVPCPEGCDCECFECGNPDCECSIPTGYCDNFPSNFEIDYVRVWQAVDDDKHQTGCSTKDRPTDLFIKAHKKRYMEDSDKEPMKDITDGGARCDSDLKCGGPTRGVCTLKGICMCHEGFTGSKCLAHDGFEEYVYRSINNSLPVSMLLLPRAFVTLALALLIGFFCSYFMIVSKRRKEKKDLLQSLPWESEIHYPITEQTAHKEYDVDVSSVQPQNVVTYSMIDGRLLDQ